jgi:rare lipoprotein A
MSCYSLTSFSWAADSRARKDDESVPPAAQGVAPQQAKSTVEPQPKPAPQPDTSARKRVGKASFYAKQFSGKTMADGVPMDPEGDNAASRTLPLGTTAKVTNVETGKTAIVTIEDRGPYVDGRLVDLSPGTAAKIGITPRQGIAKVVVAPIAVPLPDGKVKVGAAASEPENEPDHIPVHDDKAHDGKAARGEKLAQADMPVHDEKPPHAEGPVHKEKRTHDADGAADRETKLAIAAEAGNPRK